MAHFWPLADNPLLSLNTKQPSMCESIQYLTMISQIDRGRGVGRHFLYIIFTLYEVYLVRRPTFVVDGFSMTDLLAPLNLYPFNT